MSTTTRRRLRWALRGALILAGLAILLGGLFTALIGLAERRVAPDAGLNAWVGLLLPATLIWGAGALPFGAALGFFAALIWRDEGQ
jgi:hypothetical protein